jgi:hypothetical protein
VLVVVTLAVVTAGAAVVFVAEAAEVVPFPDIVVVGIVVVVVAGLILGNTSLGTAAPWLKIGAYDWTKPVAIELFMIASSIYKKWIDI